MKYLKLFKEELNPETYISAGSKLKHLGKISRGANLTDHGTEMLHGNYNVHLSDLNSSTVFTGEFTYLRCKFHYGTPEWSGPQNNKTSTLIKVEDEEELLSNWIKGSRDLSFTLEFDMFPTAKTDIKLSKSMNFSNFSGKYIPLFSIVVGMSSFNSGLEEWNYSEDEGEYIKPGDERYNDVSDMYKNNSDVRIAMVPLITQGPCGIFADRKSALKFKKSLPGLIGDRKSKIMEILSTVGGDSNDLEDILERIYSISINYLYQDEIANTITRNWFKLVY